MTKLNPFCVRTLALSLFFFWPGATAVMASELLDAVKAEDVGRVEAALAAGADANELDPSTMTPLHMAAARGSADIARLLIDAGADVEAETGTGQGKAHPLHLAAEFDHAAVAALLLEHGAKADVRDSRSNTALLIAAKSGYADVVEVLLQAGADPLAEDASYHDTAIYIAAMKGHLDVVKLIVSQGVDVNLRNSHTGETPLWVASMESRFNVMEFLLSSGADPNIADSSGKTPIKTTSDPRVLDLLRKFGASE